jgi:hypothetical protein
MEDFGQRVDLTARIREVLLNYPEGTSILKEVTGEGGPVASQNCARMRGQTVAATTKHAR